ncbi:MAG TPA: hypothetical protein DCF91_11720 [Porphyromonadaceae bacterium]|nr:hypothetical protein [Porphyromonadaceae bacterium]
MKQLLLERIQKEATYTLGKLYIDGIYYCDTLEDPDRGLDDNMDLLEIKKIKVKNNTAIPTGTYTIDLNKVSPKFKDRDWAQCCDGKIPRLNNVKGFEAVLIHVGNSPKNTSGCILVGTSNNMGGLINSSNAFKDLMKRLNSATDLVLTIK